MLLSDVTMQLGASSPYEFLTGSQWIRVRKNIRLFHDGTPITIRLTGGDYWFRCNNGFLIKAYRLTPDIAKRLTIGHRCANRLLGKPADISLADIGNIHYQHEETVKVKEPWLDGHTVKNIAFIIGSACVVTATLFGAKRVMNVLPKGRGK